jgi:hypothetical protein
MLTLLSACASFKDNTPVSLHTHLYDKPTSCLEESSLPKACHPGIPEQDILEAEKRFYPSYSEVSRDGYRPNLAIALSGGGQRAASTSIGFLTALDSSGILAKTDILSTVSGGSYAAYWFITKLHKFSEYSKMPDGGLLDYQNPSGTLRFAPLFERYYVYCRDDAPEEQWLELCGLRKEGPPPRLTVDSKKRLGNKWGRFQHHILYNGNLLTSQQLKDGFFDRSLMWLEVAARSVSVLPIIPVHWLATGVFDTKINMNVLAMYYRSGLEQQYGLFPGHRRARSRGDFPNSTSWLDWNVLRYSVEDIPIGDLVQRPRTPDIQPIPFWIINATAAYGGGWKLLKGHNLFEVNSGPFATFSRNLSDTVYEFTPVARGSSSYGYFPNSRATFPNRFSNDDRFFSVSENRYFDSHPITLSKIVSISGAAVDGLEFSGNVALDMLNLGFGQYIDNPAQPDDLRKRHQLVPFPLYLFSSTIKHDINAPSIYLSDGGHSGDNLGISSALKRRPLSLLVLDSEYEGSPSGLAAFQSLQEVVCRLKIERGITFQFAEFKEVKSLADKLNDTPCRAEKNLKVVDGKSPATLGFNVRKVSMPYLEATITIPCHGHGTRNERSSGCDEGAVETKTQLIYVKLALNEEQIGKSFSSEELCEEGGRYQCETQLYDASNPKHQWQSRFPHHSTSDINYSKTQLAGYRALGFDLGKCIEFHHSSRNMHLAVKDIGECRLPVEPIIATIH